MTTFIALSVDLHFLTALMLLPVAAIGHILGLKAHNAIMRNDLLFKRWVGGGLVAVSMMGLWDLYGKQASDFLGYSFKPEQEILVNAVIPAWMPESVRP